MRILARAFVTLANHVFLLFSPPCLLLRHLCQAVRQICSIGSGAIESTIKQIDRRTKISGAQWKAENVPQVLAHRCAYLNNLICDRLTARLRSR
jgi:hypothetical protein